MPAPSITATSDAANARVRLDVDCIEMIHTGDAADVEITRHVNGASAGAPVRVTTTDGYEPLSNGKGTLYDTEAPLDVPLTYKAVFRSAQGLINPNPSFEDNTNGWTANGGATLARSTVRAFKGAASALVTIPVTVSDTFGRTASSSWGNADSSQPWTTSGGTAAGYAVTGGVGQHVHSVLNDLRRSNIESGNSNFDITVDVSVSVGTPTGAGISTWVAGRYADDNNYYWVAMTVGITTGTATVQLFKRVAGTLTSISSAVNVGTNTAGKWWRVRFRGTGSYLRASAWAAGTAPPASWMVAADDSTLTAGTRVGVLSRVETGNTNTLPVTISWDLLSVGGGNTAFIECSSTPVKQGMKPGAYARVWHAGGGAGAPAVKGNVWVSFYTPGGQWISSFNGAISTVPAAAWTELKAENVALPGNAGKVTCVVGLDEVAPGTQVWVDTAGIMIKRGVRDDNAVTAAAPAAATLPSGGAWWLKDPVRPGNNIKVLMDFDYSTCDVPTGVVFVGLDAETYAAASAAFDVDQGTQPIVLSAPRKDVESSMSLLCATFADRDRLAALLAAGSPLLFQGPGEYGIPDRYISVGAVAVGRLAADHRKQWRVFTLPFVAVAAPAGPSQGVTGTRWRDLCNQYATWDDLTAAGLTWRQIKQGAAG